MYLGKLVFVTEQQKTMKASLKHTKLLTVLTGTVALMTTAALADTRGTDILHYNIKKLMVNEGVEPTATGRVDLRQNHQGHVTVQMLGITVRKLAASTPYQVIIPVEPADPAVPPTVVASFTTDRRGNAALHFRSVVHDNGTVMSIGRGQLPLPDSVNPLTGVRKLVVAGSDGVALLTADLSAPTRLNYLVKRDLSTDTLRATLQLVANNTAAYLRLYAFTLPTSTDYFLVLDNGIPEKFTTDTRGRLLIRAHLENPLDILNLHSVELRDAVNNVVLGTTVP